MKRNLFDELKRRNVFRAAAFYIPTIWALAQGISQLSPTFGMPEWGTRWFVIAGAIGFPFCIAFAWLYEIKWEGLKRWSEIDPAQPIVANKKFDRWIIAIMAIVIVLLLTNIFVPRKGAVSIPEQSIAVVPFSNMSSDKEQEYFSDGISEDLLNLLTRIPQLQVTAWASSRSFKGKEFALQDIVQKLKVAHLLEGSVQKYGDQVRVTVQLVDTASGIQRWSETYDRKSVDIFQIQDQIAAEVVKQLRIRLAYTAPKARTTDPNAYALYLQAVQLGRRNTVEAYEKCDALYRQALALDPRYVPAWVGLASSLMTEANYGVLTPNDGFARARDAAEKAVALDSDYAPAHTMLGFVMVNGFNDLAGAAHQFERALELDPGDVYVLRNVAVFLQILGRVDKALLLNEAVVYRDPVNATSYLGLGLAQRWAGKFDAATATYHTGLSLNPHIGEAYFLLGVTLLMKGDAPTGLVEIKKESDEAWRMIGLPMAYHALGQKANADTALAALIAKHAEDAAFNIAYIYAFRGDADKAFEWLETAVKHHEVFSEILAENLFDNIHSDPRWLPLLHKVGYAPEQLANIQFKVTLPQPIAL